MKLEITITMDSPAFEGDPLEHAALILAALVRDFQNDEFLVDGHILAAGWPLRDYDGNKVGIVKVTN